MRLLLFFSFIFSLSISQYRSTTIYPDKLRQTIDGFGASNAWISYSFYKNFNSTLQNQVFDALFSPTSGLGLSILRNRVPNTLLTAPNTWNWNDWDLTNTVKQWNTISSKYGIKTIFSTPWTPPPFMKDNNNSIQGSLLTSSYSDYANYLADYVNGMRTRFGINLTAVSIQNEPDWKPNYESCTWNGSQFHTFVRDYLAPAFKAKNVHTQIMFPESMTYTEDLAVETLNDTQSRDSFNILGVHQYHTTTKSSFALSKAAGKRIWVTENGNLGKTYNGTIDDALVWAKTFHNALTQTEVNAYCYWWLYNALELKNDCLVSVLNGSIFISKRTWAFGHFSRFIRPGYQRVQSDVDPLPNVYVSAYLSNDYKQIVVVAINAGLTGQKTDLSFNGRQINEWESYRTSPYEDMKFLGGTIIGNSIITVSLESQSINTFVGNFA